MKILIFNAGSSSLKFSIFQKKGARLNSIFQGHFDNYGKPIRDFHRAVQKALDLLLRKKIMKYLHEISGIGHRVVHGGEKFIKPVQIMPNVIAAVRNLSQLAPLHNPPNLACILACKKIFPAVPQVAVFDTAFHATMPEKAYLYGLPYSLSKQLRIRRFGFHGTSHQYVFEQARKKLGPEKTRRTITCHLGNGCSITAILNGKVIDTSMGFTPLEGVPMGTRSGNIDPGIIFYLAKKGISWGKMYELLNGKSGLLGVSGISSDMRDLWAAHQKAKVAAKRTLEWFTYRIAMYIGAYTMALGGLDCLIFTGGIGENAWYLRKWILAYLKGIIKPRVLVIKTDEERKIAQEVVKVISHENAHPR